MDFPAWQIKVVLIFIVVMQIFVFYAFDMGFHLKKVQDSQDSWIKAKGGVENLNRNPIYSKFKIMRPAIRKKTNLLIIVSSAPKRRERRSAIRETWWKDCVSSDQVIVKCIFITDQPDGSSPDGKKLIKEQRTHNDLVFQNLSGGVEFGKRFLYHMVWAMQNYEFDYFLRMDDDYFFCLKRFLHELPMPMRPMYHWGYVHCLPNIVRPEESVILFSRDLIEVFLNQDPYEMKGHPWADQMIATWVKDLNIPALYNHDRRLHHDPPLKFMKNITQRFKKVCDNFIGVHGSYPKDMRLLWRLYSKYSRFYANLDLYTSKCEVPQRFNWTLFADVWRYEPKKLIDNPSWNTTKQKKDDKEYLGREGGQV
ncbi:uncharacterized protein LOC135685923 isoform X2 [Rhopilema esculentum]|uniref:uncharacterized protein LOC135685923 isoform X2 n=1 Tax=Rhopilema esculentum TaxID=499914 RepID=UPI0031D4DB05